MNISKNKPLYYQLKHTILKWIENGEYEPGDMLPTELQLQEMFSMSRTTVRMAMKELEQEGFIVRSPGKGTFVSSIKIESGPRRLLSFTQEMSDLGMNVTNQLLSLEKEFPAVRTANKLQINPDQRVWRFERVRMVDSVPVVLEINYIPSAIIHKPDMPLKNNQSFYAFLEEQHGIVIAYARERVSCRLASSRECKLLNIPKNSPVLYVERQTFGYLKSRPMETFPVEFVKMTYSAEKYTFHQIIKKD